MEAVLYTFSKRHNSTAIPNNTGETVNVLLKKSTSLYSPVFEISRNEINVNYIKFDNKYYWIDDIISINFGVWELHCTIDVLASYKSYILNTTAFIQYDTTANLELPDIRIPPKTTPVTVTNIARFSTKLSTRGTAILSVTGEDSIATYAMDLSTAKSLLSNLNSWLTDEIPDVSTESLQDFGDSIVKGFRQLIGTGTAGDSIKSAIWIPWDVDVQGLDQIKLGLYNTRKGAGIITDRIYSGSSTIKIPWTFTDWRRCPPYTQIYLYIPFVGQISINSGNVIGKDTITMFYNLDVVTGEMTVQVFCEGEPLGIYGANTGVQIAIGASNINPVQLVTSLIGGVSSLATGNYSAAASSAFNAIQPNLMTVGGISGASGASENLFNTMCTVVAHDTIATPDSVRAIMGTPNMSVKKLSTLSGYVQTVGASVNAPTSANNITTLNSLLDGGVYIE